MDYVYLCGVSPYLSFAGLWLFEYTRLSFETEAETLRFCLFVCFFSCFLRQLNSGWIETQGILFVKGFQGSVQVLVLCMVQPPPFSLGFIRQPATKVSTELPVSGLCRETGLTAVQAWVTLATRHESPGYTRHGETPLLIVSWTIHTVLLVNRVSSSDLGLGNFFLFA